MADIVIDLENATVVYRNSYALRGVSLKVGAGEFVGIIGPNGAGKTTLLTVINGLTRLTGGECRVLGRDLSSGDGRSLRKAVGYVAQLESVDRRMPMTVRDVAALGRYGRLGFLRRPGPGDSAVVDEMLGLVGMRALADRPIGQLSGGEQQRVAIARCLAQEPQLFLLDEPTASLDWKAQSEILELVKRIHRERRVTTLFVTHDIDALPHTCDRVVLMKKGLVVGDGAPDSLISTENLSRLYEMPEEVVRERRPHVHTDILDHR
jgi:ABC-type Mn2+/Zn2+ transport system ATPase subunit